MGRILKQDFNGENLNQKIKKDPEKKYLYEKYMKDADYSDIALDGLSVQEMFRIGKDYSDGKNGRDWDCNTGKKYFQAAAEKNYTEAMCELANQYRTDVYPFYTKAMYWYKKAALQNVLSGVMAQCRIAKMYKEGEGTEQDYKQALYWYEEAGKSKADFDVKIDGKKGVNWKNYGLSRAAMIYYFGEEGVQQNRAKAIEYFKKAAENGDEDEIPNYFLGLEYLNGKHLEKDYEKARTCFENGVYHMQAWALACLDYMYETGKVQSSEYKSAAQWYTEKKVNGKAAEQLAYILSYRDDFVSNMIDYHKKIFSVLPAESLLYKAVNGKADGYERGIFWFEVSAQTNFDKSFYQLVNIYNYNIDNGLNKPPTAERIRFLATKYFPVDEKDEKNIFTLKDCGELIDKFPGLSEFVIREGLLSLDSKIENEKNVFIKAGLKLAWDGIDNFIIKTILESLLEIDKKEGIDLTARKIIVQGIISVQSADDPDITRKKLYDILGGDAEKLVKEWDRDSLPTDNAWIYNKRGHLHYHNKDYDRAIADFQKAVELADDEDDRQNFNCILVNICMEKQNAQTPEERLTPYAQMAEKLKTGKLEKIGSFLGFNKLSDYVDFAAALAFFEEYNLLGQLLSECDKSKVLNTPVSPVFCFWGPTPFYNVTTKNAWIKMKDTKKMLKFLIENGADINAAAADGSTPLLNWTYTDSLLENLQTLLELGANPNKTVIEDDVELALLARVLVPEYLEEEKSFYPFKEHAINQAKLLLEYGADPNFASPGYMDFPPLVSAIRYGFVTENGPNKGSNPCGILDLLKLLIKKGADVNFLDSDGNTPLSIAKDNNLSEVEKILLENGALMPDELEGPGDDGRGDTWS